MNINENKQACIDMAEKVLNSFIKKNKMKAPKLIISGKDTKYSGEYYNKTLYVYHKNCRSPVKVPNNWGWSYPGYKADRTPYGVIMHEMGHYIWENYFHPNLRKLPAKEKVSSYEPNLEERAAETFKLFIGNPDLLKVLCPNRYKLIVKAGFNPIIFDDWKTVLKDAHVKFIQAIENKISIIS